MGLSSGAGGGDLGGPLGDQGRICAGLQGGAVAGQALVTVGDDPAGFGRLGEQRGVVVIVLSVSESGDRGR
ncbi:hypothetical protein WEI85_44640 [Actinomycetes bacterium KLBMP 9797]